MKKGYRKYGLVWSWRVCYDLFSPFSPVEMGQGFSQTIISLHRDNCDSKKVELLSRKKRRILLIRDLLNTVYEKDVDKLYFKRN